MKEGSIAWHKDDRGLVNMESLLEAKQQCHFTRAKQRLHPLLLWHRQRHESVAPTALSESNTV
jgi:hypothetical protein